MGYILPYPNYQYQKYAERVNSHQYDPFNIMAVSKISLRKTAQENQQELQEDSLQRKTTFNSSHAAKAGPIPAYLVAEVTGKGKHVNEYI
ncbi:hypothetical protein [Bacillus sp. 2205SS5-2]|uniref:hypothetical protein n=1 Tax=Bacillus sp. 2205SS5-2 TaxID=3109031 RepID=UPI0030066AE0